MQWRTRITTVPGRSLLWLLQRFFARNVGFVSLATELSPIPSIITHWQAIGGPDTTPSIYMSAKYDRRTPTTPSAQKKQRLCLASFVLVEISLEQGISVRKTIHTVVTFCYAGRLCNSLQAKDNNDIITYLPETVRNALLIKLLIFIYCIHKSISSFLSYPLIHDLFWRKWGLKFIPSSQS